MKTKSKHPVRTLRKILGQTQAEFAVMVGASKDAVVSWENGRNPLSETFARRIALATGVEGRSLLKSSGPLLTQNPNPRRPFTAEEFQKHRKDFWGHSAEESVRRQLRPGADTLELLLTAAAKAGEGEGPPRLPGVLDSFNQWCKQTAEDFQLGEQIDAQLAQRKGRLELNRSYAQWRAMAKADPNMARRFGFKDDPMKNDTEMLCLGMDTIPVWAPGWDMRGGKR